MISAPRFTCPFSKNIRVATAERAQGRRGLSPWERRQCSFLAACESGTADLAKSAAINCAALKMHLRSVCGRRIRTRGVAGVNTPGGNCRPKPLWQLRPHTECCVLGEGSILKGAPNTTHLLFRRQPPTEPIEPLFQYKFRPTRTRSLPLLSQRRMLCSTGDVALAPVLFPTFFVTCNFERLLSLAQSKLILYRKIYSCGYTYTSYFLNATAFKNCNNFQLQFMKSCRGYHFLYNVCASVCEKDLAFQVLLEMKQAYIFSNFIDNF